MKFAWITFLLVLLLASVMDACTLCNGYRTSLEDSVSSFEHYEGSAKFLPNLIWELLKISKEYRMMFQQHGTTDYAIKENSIVYDLNAVSVCLFVRDTDDNKPSHPQGYPTQVVYSYAVPVRTHELELFTYPKLLAHVGGKKSLAEVTIDYGQWNHICFTWSNTNGDYKFYKDGVIVGSGTGLHVGGMINSGGTTVIGQDQDSVLGGDFDPIQSLVGDLTEVNVWGVELSESDIAAQYSNCQITQGSVNWWSQFKDGVHGDVVVVEP